MEEILNSPEFQKLAPYLPYISFAGFLRLAIMINLCISVRSSLLLMREENRCIVPGQVWFLLLPFFNIYWNFIVVRRFTDSLNNEFYDRKVAIEEKPTEKSGYWFAGSFLVYNFPIPLFVSFGAFIIGIITLILYTVKVNEYKKLLMNTPTDVVE